MNDRDWCYCGNSRPVLKLTDDKCFRECPGNFKQHCGGPLAMNVYETGIEGDLSCIFQSKSHENIEKYLLEYRFDSEGTRIEESLIMSRQEFVLKFDCDRKYI